MKDGNLKKFLEEHIEHLECEELKAIEESAALRLTASIIHNEIIKLRLVLGKVPK